MIGVLDSGGVSALAGDRDRLRALQVRVPGPWRVPAPVLVECLTGAPGRDATANRLLKACRVVPVEEVLARAAAALRAGTGRKGGISAVDAVVAALAVGAPEGAAVVTSDPDDLRLLCRDHPSVLVVPV